MADDTKAARAAFDMTECFTGHPEGNPSDDFIRGWNAALNDAWKKYLDRSIPAAAALLREAGWTVEEPKCERCMGGGRVRDYKSETGDRPCPTCDGTGARILEAARMFDALPKADRENLKSQIAWLSGNQRKED